MAKQDATKVLWRVQVRASRTSAWRNKSGLFETREAARIEAFQWRGAYGFGNTRVLRHVRGQR